LLDVAGCGRIGALGLGCAAVSAPGPRAPATAWIRAIPNPTGGPVRIEFWLPREEPIELDVFDLQGRRVALLVRTVLPAGDHAVQWQGSHTAESGLYFVRLRRPGGDLRLRLVRSR
jgi:hypothetical protein